jgi:PAS domain S-box-containing protein
VLVPIALWIWVAVETRKLALETAEADQRRVTQTLSQHTLKVLEAQALILDVVADQAGERDCASMHSDAALQHALAVATRRSAPVEIVWVLDADGYLCASSDPAMMDTRSRAFRDYFSKARDLAPNRFFVDRASTGLFTGLPYFGISKPRMKNGTFNGVILATVNGDGMTHAWDAMLGVTPTQQIGVFRQDGATIARSWDPPAPAPDDDAERRRAATWQSGPNGGGTRASLIDGTWRLGAWRSLPGWDVVVTSSVDEGEALRPWRRSTLIYGMLAALTSGMSGALTWLLLRGQRTLLRTVDQRTLALRRSEDRLSLFIDGAPAGIALFDRDMRYLAVSRRYLQDYGLQRFQPEEIVGRSHYEMLPHIPVHGPETHRRVLAGETFPASDCLYPRADGGFEWIRWEMAPWHQPDGLIGGAVLFSEVVTERKQIEAVLSRDKEGLEQLVTARTRELVATQTRLAHAQRLEALGQLAGGIAHDFNNVIQAVQGGANLIKRRPGDADRTCSLADMITEAAGRGASITRRLLAFSRQSDLLAEPLDAEFLLAGMREILAHTIGAAIDVKMEVQAALPPLLADKGQLETVLVNLATNARDAMPRGGTLILAAVLEVLQQSAELSHPVTLQAGSYVCLSVSDDGEGMLPTVLARASEPFFTTKGVSQGTGLGLAMARGFTEQSGGGFRIDSVRGHGTVVRLWFPVAKVGAHPAVPPPKPRGTIVPIIDRACLLIVDDDAIVLETLTQEMQTEGYVVLAAASGIEALALLDAGATIDLVVTDYSMPGMDGVTLIREVHRRRPMLPAILLTGFTANAAEIAIDGAISGAFTLLRKPIGATLLAERAAALLEKTSVDD